jgi:hypothetical protein
MGPVLAPRDEEYDKEVPVTRRPAGIVPTW